MKEKIQKLLFDKAGGLTRKLVQEPGAFGLGKTLTTQQPDRTSTLICGFCSTGCGLNLHLKDGQALSLTPDTDYPVNLGMACPKGWEALAVMDSDDRGTIPLKKSKEGVLDEEISWQQAASLFCDNFKSIQADHGNESVAFISTGQIVVEEMAFLGALAKFGMGMIHGDGNTRQCMATAAVSYKQSFGFDAPPYSYKDFEESDTLVFVGANPCIAHPIMWERVMMNPHNPEIIVIDPRFTETAMASTLHLPIKPKSDLTLLYSIARWLIEVDAIDVKFIAQHTNGFDEFKAFVKNYSIENAAEVTGVKLEVIHKLCQKIATGQRVSYWWTMGVNQSHEGTRTAQALINLALMTGNIGKPGTGANSITGQCNAMGSRLYSNTTNLLGARSFTSEPDRREVAELLNIPYERIPDQDSMPYHQILESIDTGKIKGLWVICTNPGHSWIDQPRFRELINKLDYLVVQDLYPNTETAQLADLYFPAAGWGEKEGCFINSERRFGLVKRIKKAPGEALADFNIFRLLSEAWGCGDLFRSWSSPEAVFHLIKKLSKGRPCDIGGIEDYQMLDEQGGIQWPYPVGGDKLAQERRLFEDGEFYHPDGKAKFIFEASSSTAEAVDEKYPMILLTGRGSAAQWHTQTRTDKSAVLRQLYPKDAYVEIHPDDAMRLAVKANEWISICSRRGKIKARAYISTTVQSMQIFMPMHYAETNILTKASFDPYSHQPSYKHCAVNISAVK